MPRKWLPLQTITFGEISDLPNINVLQGADGAFGSLEGKSRMEVALTICIAVSPMEISTSARGAPKHEEAEAPHKP